MAEERGLKIGPFLGGLNTLSDSTSIADNELVECDNFELDVDGSLVSRPPIADLAIMMPLGATGNMRLLGYYTTALGAAYLIGSDGLSSTYYYDGTAWILITSTISASAMCQFREKAWLVSPPGAANPGGQWDPVGGFTAEPNMPRGGCIVENKERLWLGGGSAATSNGARLYLTEIVNGSPSWPATPQYITIGSGDGQNIIDLAVYFSDIVIFKARSTYRFSFSSDPATGQTIRVSSNVGVATTGSFAAFENDIYVLFDNKVYQFTNYNFERLNTKVPLKSKGASASLAETGSISVFADRLFVAFFDMMYVYNLRTRSWSTWSSTVVQNIGRIWAVPGQQGERPRALTYSTTPRTNKLFEIVDEVGSNVEQMTCAFTTKNYDFLAPAKFKRLFSTGVDVIARQSIEAFAVPISYSTSLTWNDLADKIWNELGTWDRPLEVSLIVEDDISVGGLTAGRKFIKLFKSLRFRQLSYRMLFTTDGSANTAPVRVYSIIAFVKEKQDLSKRIS